MAVSAMPAFGGGIWSAALLSHNIGLSRREGALWLVAGSVVSYGILWSLGIGTLRIMRTWI